MASRYGAKSKQKVARAVRKQKSGKLRSGSGGKVKSRKQAIAIGLSEARSAGGKVPRKSGGAKKKTVKKKTAKKKSSGGRRKSSGGGRKKQGS
jgi:hypothetical protein